MVKQNGIDEPMPEDPDRNGEDEADGNGNGNGNGNGGSEEDDENGMRPPDTPREPRSLPWTPKVR